MDSPPSAGLARQRNIRSFLVGLLAPERPHRKMCYPTTFLVVVARVFRVVLFAPSCASSLSFDR